MIQVRPTNDRGMVLQVHLSGLGGSLVRRTEKAHSPMAQVKARKPEAVSSSLIAPALKMLFLIN